MYFDHPWWTPTTVNFLPAVWMKYRGDLEDVVLAHPKVFPGYVKGSKDFDEITDPFHRVGDLTTAWGCGWHNEVLGMVGQAVRHPLADWAAMEQWTPPDPLRDDLLGPRDWKKVEQDLAAARREHRVTWGGGLPHNMVFLLLTDLRGFENLMLDLATDEPNLHKLIGIITRHNVAVIRKYLELGVEMMGFGEDQGLQNALPMNPAMWRKFFKPTFEAMYGPCRDAGVPVYMHTDGHILEIIPDLIETGVRVLNPQWRANGMAGLVEAARGKVALAQDLDRQLLPFVTPAGVEEHIGQVHEALVMDSGGLMLVAEVTPDFPLANVDAICTAMEKVCRLPDPGEH
jgi:hypothetical protein